MNVNFERASRLFELRRFPEAEERLITALADEPGYAPAHALLAAVKLNLRELPAARATIDVALELQPYYAFAHYILACVLRNEEKFAEADAELAVARELEPEQPFYFAEQAEFCFAREQWWQALEWAEQGLAIDPEHRGCMEQEIQALMHLELFDRADEAVLRYLHVDPNSAEGQRRKGWLEFRKGNKELAVEAFRSGAELAPEDGAAIMQIARFAKPAQGVATGLLKRVARTILLPHKLQFAIALAPTLFYVAAILLIPDNRVVEFVAALWTALTTAAFGAAFILQTINYDLTLSVLRAPAVSNHASAWTQVKERLFTWFMIGLGVLCVGYIYFAIIFLPFLLRDIGVAVLVCLSGITGYRVLRQRMIRSAYNARKKKGVTSWFVRSLFVIDIRAVVVCSLVAGAVAGIVWGKFDFKPTQKMPPPASKPTPRRSIVDDLRVDPATGKAFDASGKRILVGEGARRLFGWPPEPPDDEPREQD